MLISKPWEPLTLYAVSSSLVLVPDLIVTNHCILETTHRACHFGDALTQLSISYSLAFVRVAQIHWLAHCSCFQHINFEN